ncbi:WecB/TagA/CpsF family glycosyltransferase [Gillisia sp. Q332]|uniref:WecB/TagA/CpsF family glycosyltransferase n=1 Tax=Gillisia xinjiangensis TaxID=3384765 RepID=UPI00391B2344
MDYKLLNGVQTFAPKSREDLISFALKGQKILVAVNAEKILHATDVSRGIINRNLGYPDGIGAVMALKQKGIKSVVKIPGCELWLDIIKAYHNDKSFYLVGGKQEIVEGTVSKLKFAYPKINIVNFRNGYLKTEQEKLNLIDDIARRKPDVVFVAMGSPKQELLMEEMRQKHPALYQGLGGSFDVYTGNVDRAPKWWVDNNLEWAYRLVKQPSRITRQIHLVKFVYLLKMNKL